MPRRAKARPITSGHSLRNLRVNDFQPAEGTAVKKYYGKLEKTEKQPEEPKKLKLSQGSGVGVKLKKAVDRRPCTDRKPHLCPNCTRRFTTAVGVAAHLAVKHASGDGVASGDGAGRKPEDAKQAAPVSAPQIRRFAGASASDAPTDQRKHPTATLFRPRMRAVTLAG